MRTLILASLLAACQPSPDFFTAYGTAVFLNGVKVAKEHIDLATKIALDTIEVHRPWWKPSTNRDGLDAAHLILYDEPIPCDAAGVTSGLCSGVYEPSKMRIHIHHDSGCFAHTAYIHELGHLFTDWQTKFRRIDEEHTDLLLWSWLGDSSIEFRDLLCPIN